MSADGSNGGRVIPLRAREPGEQLTPEEAQRRLTHLTLAVKSEPLRWALTILQQVARNPHPPQLERTPIPAYLADAPEAIRAAAQRAYVRGEAERDLRASMRAEVLFRGAGETRHAGTLAAFHRERWHIDAVSDDLQEREAQLRAALNRRYGR